MLKNVLKYKFVFPLFLTMGICSGIGLYHHNFQTIKHKEVGSQVSTVVKPIQSSRENKPINAVTKTSVSDSDTEKVTAGSKSNDTKSYSYSDLNKYLYATANLFIRDLPSVDGTILGSLSIGQGIHIIGQCNETGWYEVNYKGMVGYISNEYVSESKPQKIGSVSESDTNTDNNTSGNSGIETVSEQSPSVKYNWKSNGTTQADIDRGNLILYRTNYWAADIVTPIGRQIYSLGKGDIVVVDGVSVQIDGEVHSNYWVDYVEDTREKIAAQGGAYDSPAFQTCEPHSCGPIVIKYGHKI